MHNISPTHSDELDNDDLPVGRILTRREVLALLGVTGASLLAACAVPAMTEGPYFVDAKLNRSDIRAEPSDGSTVEGTPLALTFRVSRVTPDGCSPLAGATFDIGLDLSS